eukprot:CAMPEP_0113712492 /NCGR_PEP_ID=MMETSP0038_2-20120614/31422_1 /TAXON_ID=2898 /ORGANISM="Cryptomonas paramecium" /LENGTH=48 /DNA_ID=CAMNT_0000639025 /DNA_START=88 /DNA_END=230 /DNA_ORIENTATION=- /assembly_acc=CAM_ASM_000170
MPSWGVQTPPSCDVGPRNLGASIELNSAPFSLAAPLALIPPLPGSPRV